MATAESLSKITESVTMIVSRCKVISSEGSACALPDMAPSDFISALLEKSYLADAIQFLAFGLPGREAVWWGYLAAHEAALDAGAPAVALACLEATEAWVYNPTEENRRAVFPLAEALGFDTYAGYLGLAVFWSGGSLAPLGLEEIAPDPALTPTAVAASVVLASLASSDSTVAPHRQRIAVLRGVDIAKGGNGRLKPTQ